MQKTDEYWSARVDKLLGSGQKAEFSEDRTSLHWKIKNLYHGSDWVDIDELDFAEESTVGDKAVYFTIDPTLAIGYAKLRGKERKTGKAALYEAMVSDVSLMNWAELKTVEKLKADLAEFANVAIGDLHSLAYDDFSKKYGLWESLADWKQQYVQLALERIIEKCTEEDFLHGANIKTVAQGIMGIFFQRFIESRGFDGIITIEGGDDEEFTGKPGVSIALYNKTKIRSHRPFNVTPEA